MWPLGRTPFFVRADDSQRGAHYMTSMKKFVLFTPLFALLALALWFLVATWQRLTGDSIPAYGWAAIIGGVFFSLLVGGGLMALIFYSNRHGYDDLSGGDGQQR